MSAASPSVPIASDPPFGVFKRYQEELPDDISAARRILEHYSGIPAEAVEAHIHSVVCVNRPLNAYFCTINSTLPGA